MAKKRLQSKLAKRALELSIEKKLGVPSARVFLRPYFRWDVWNPPNVRCLPEVELEFKDGKDERWPLILNGQWKDGTPMCGYLMVPKASFALLARIVEKEVAKGTFFTVADEKAIGHGWSIEGALVEVDLENCMEQKQKG